MKRMFTATLAGSALALGVPALALAHGRHHHHHSNHSRHANGARLLRFGNASFSATPTATAPNLPITLPTTNEAGTVVSFENEVLTILLADKKTEVSGKVTQDTELRCVSSNASTGDQDDQGSGDDQGDQGDEHGNGDNQNGDNQGSNNQSGDQGQVASHGDVRAHSADSQDDQDDQQQQSCPANALQKGATVLEAELKLSSAGAVWKRVVLALP